MPLFDVKLVAVDSSSTNMRIEMPLFNVKFVAADRQLDKHKINESALHENRHSSVVS